jgi:hypothetical protein
MASTYIEMNGTGSRLGGSFRQLIDQARSMQDACTKIKRIMDVAKDGTVDEDASFVTLGGLLGITPAKARDAYNQLVLFQTVINKPNYDTFIDRLG